MAPAKPPEGETYFAWFHPQRGAVLTKQKFTVSTRRYLGGADTDWRSLGDVEMLPRPTGYLMPASGETLPAGFLWADASRQSFGLGGPLYFYGPLEGVCRECGEAFVTTAEAQRHLYETVQAFIDTKFVRCRGCATRRTKIERARTVFADALHAAEAASTADAHLAVARAAVELISAGGRTSIDKALGHVRRARKLGADPQVTDPLEARLKELREA